MTSTNLCALRSGGGGGSGSVASGCFVVASRREGASRFGARGRWRPDARASASPVGKPPAPGAQGPAPGTLSKRRTEFAGRPANLAIIGNLDRRRCWASTSPSARRGICSPARRRCSVPTRRVPRRVAGKSRHRRCSAATGRCRRGCLDVALDRADRHAERLGRCLEAPAQRALVQAVDQLRAPHAGGVGGDAAPIPERSQAFRRAVLGQRLSRQGAY